MPEIEYKVETIPLDDNYQKRCEELSAERWQTVQGANPVAVFHLFRVKEEELPKAPAGFGAHGVLTVDDSKVGVMRNGKIVG